MKCKLLRPEKRVNPDWNEVAEIVARTYHLRYDTPRWVEAPAGTEISDPECYKLVRMGMAEPSDDECRERCGMTQEQIATAAFAQEKVSKGIHPDDYNAYDRGEMVGYNPDGTFIRGPNWDQYQDDDDLFSEEEEYEDDE